MKILVIEDDADIREVLSLLLSMEGFDVSVAEDGLIGLEYLRSAATLPDLVLLDLVMPFMDGYEFRREQKRDPRLSRIPVIIMTANQLPEDQTLGAAGFLRKPVALDQVVVSIRAIEKQISESRDRPSQ